MISSTPSHPYYVEGRGYIEAKYLRAGDKLLSVNGQKVVVEWVQHELLESPITVYNFEVQEHHNYFVGDSAGVLVHNACGPKNVYKARGRTDAFHQAKKELGIPKTQQPKRIAPNKNKFDKIQKGRMYIFEKGGQDYAIVDDIAGHRFADGGSFGRHFNLDIWNDDLKTFVRFSDLHLLY